MTHSFYCLTVNFKKCLNLTWFYLYFYSHNACIQACKCMCAHRHTHTPALFLFASPTTPSMFLSPLSSPPQCFRSSTKCYFFYKVCPILPKITIHGSPEMVFFSIWACACFSYTGPLLISSWSKGCLFHVRQYKPHNHKPLPKFYLLQYPPSLN